MYNKRYVSLAETEKEVREVPGMSELIDTEYAALCAADFIKHAREEAHLSRSALARKLGVSPARITEIEAGEGRYGPSVALLARIVTVCGIGTLKLSVEPNRANSH